MSAAGSAAAPPPRQLTRDLKVHLRLTQRAAVCVPRLDTAESSVVCSGRPGSLFQEFIDAQTFAEWGVGLVKNDNCGEYSYGNARFHVFADAVASLGSKMIISTEPFSLVPNPNQGRFAHYWRTGNDIGAAWTTILNRIDINDKWARYAGPGHFNDPDMVRDLKLSELNGSGEPIKMMVYIIWPGRARLPAAT